MTTLEFLSHLRKLNLQLSMEGERLRYNRPKAILTPELWAELRSQTGHFSFFKYNQRGHIPYNAVASGAVSRDDDLPLSYPQAMPQYKH